MKKLSTLLSIVILASLVIIGCSNTNTSNQSKGSSDNKDKKYVMKFAHTNAPSPEDPYQAYSAKLKELIEKGTNGNIEVQIYPGGQMGGEQRAFQDVQNNILQGTIIAVNNASVFSPSMGSFDLPYMFQSVDDFNKVINDHRDLLNEALSKEAGVTALSWTQQGFRVISNSKKPIETISDLKGVKIRVPENPLQLATFKSWGSEAVPVAFDELFNALQQKVVDGQENPYVSIYTNKFQEVQKYITEVHYKLWVGPMVVNSNWLNSLPEEYQKVVINAGLEAEKFSNELVTTQEDNAKKKLEEAGVVLSGTPKDEDVWIEKAMTVWPQFYDKIGDQSILDAFLKTLGREKP